jgi:hypothetical protein
MLLKEMPKVLMCVKNAMAASATKVHCNTIFAINQKTKLKSRCSSAQSVVVFIIIAFSYPIIKDHTGAYLLAMKMSRSMFVSSALKNSF